MSKAIVFTDWDGTVTLQDSNDMLTDNLGFGVEKRKQLNQLVLEGKTDFRHAFKEMLDSVNVPFPECIDYLVKHIKLDPGFRSFYEWAKSQGIPIIIVSSGMIPIIETLLEKLVGKDARQDIEIIANNVKYLDKNGDKWDIVYRDESGFGHDKSRAIRPYANKPNRPLLFYCGDGVSDLSAARETDLLFAKTNRDLITYCKREKIPFCEFHSFSDIHSNIKNIVEGKTSIAQVNENN